MKRVILVLLGCLLMPVWAQGLTFVSSKLAPSPNKTLRRILPRPDKQEEPTAVLFIKTDILNVSVRGHVIGVPRRVNEGYILFVPQGVDHLQLNAPLYQTQTIRFAPLKSGHYYEMTLSTQEDPATRQEAALHSHELDLQRTHISLELNFDYMDIPEEVRQEQAALIYLDKTLDFNQWQQLLIPGGPYRTFDVSGNDKNPCCIIVPDGELVENVFRTNRVELDGYVENLEGGATYHTTLTLQN